MVGGAIISLLVGEVAVRVFHLAPVFDVVYQGTFQLAENPILQYELRPGSEDGGAKISSAGLRDREFTIIKPRDVFRVVVVGDSVTFGYQLDRNETFPKRLEFLLNRYAQAGSPTYEVLNLGVNGYNTIQSAEALRVRGLRFDPDLIIYAYVLNDPQGYSVEAEALAILGARAAKPLGMARYFPRSILLRMLSAQVRRLSPARRVGHIDDPGFFAFEGGTYRAYFHALHREEESWSRVRTGVATLARLTTQPRRIPLLVAVVPLDTGQEFTTYPFQDLHEQVIAEVRESGLQALDLAPVFRLAGAALDESLYVDFLHPNMEGNEVIAMAMLKWLDESSLPPGDEFDWEQVRNGDGLEARIARAILISESE